MFRNKGLQRTAQGALALLGAAAILYSVDYVFVEQTYLSSLMYKNKDHPYEYDGHNVKLRIPSELDPESRRQLSLNLGGGNCLWQVRPQKMGIYYVSLT